MSFSLPNQDQKASYVLHQFDRIAKKYDLTNDVISMGMHRFWKTRAIKGLELKADGHYLDVCCGTGDLTLMIAEKLGSEGGVTGVDFSPGMLDVAHQRSARASRANVKLKSRLDWKQGDAQNLPFADDSFDGAIVSFGLRNLTDFQRGISEMARVVKPGGWVLNLDLGKSEVPVFAPVFKLYFRHIVPIIGEVIQSDRQAYTYLPESMTTYPSPAGITELFKNAGLENIEHIPLALHSVALHRGMVPLS